MDPHSGVMQRARPHTRRGGGRRAGRPRPPRGRSQRPRGEPRRPGHDRICVGLSLLPSTASIGLSPTASSPCGWRRLGFATPSGREGTSPSLRPPSAPFPTCPHGPQGGSDNKRILRFRYSARSEIGEIGDFVAFLVASGVYGVSGDYGNSVAYLVASGVYGVSGAHRARGAERRRRGRAPPHRAGGWGGG